MTYLVVGKPANKTGSAYTAAFNGIKTVSKSIASSLSSANWQVLNF
jgi:hypothetical protein